MPSAIKKITKTPPTAFSCITVMMVSQGMKKPSSKVLKNVFSMNDELLTHLTLVTPTFLKFSPAIEFDCLLHINEEIYPYCLNSTKVFGSLETVIKQSLFLLSSKTKKVFLPLHRFAKILHVSYEGVCMYMVDWSLAYLPKSMNPNPTYLTPLDDLVLVHDTIFNIDLHPLATLKKENLSSETLFKWSLVK
nr:hypothetical protein [Tanacetum cinerariifolium]